MLAKIGIFVLIIMIISYIITATFGVYCAGLHLVKKHIGRAIRTMLYLLLLIGTTIICIVPFLRMHGSYDDIDRLIIIFLCLANILLMAFFIKTRIKILREISHHGSYNKAPN